jgi:hypothetical protein
MPLFGPKEAPSLSFGALFPLSRPQARLRSPGGGRATLSCARGVVRLDYVLGVLARLPPFYCFSFFCV